jgi:hypothetical protein
MEHMKMQKQQALEIVTALRKRVEERIRLREVYPIEFRFDCLFLGPLVNIMHLRL